MRGVLKRTSMGEWAAGANTQWGMFTEKHWYHPSGASAPVDAFSTHEWGVSFGREGPRRATHLWEVRHEP